MIEHLEKDDGWKLINEMKKHAEKALILSLPIGESVQGEKYGNKYEIRQSAWNRRDFRSIGAVLKEFKCHGNLRVAAVVFPRNDHYRWLMKFMNNPLRRFCNGVLARIRELRNKT